MNSRNACWSQFLPIGLFIRIEAFITPLDSINIFDLIIEPERHNELSDDNIETRAEASACYDSCFNLVRIKKDIFSRSTFKELDRCGNIFDGVMLL
jgi:hypothetical protein